MHKIAILKYHEQCTDRFGDGDYSKIAEFLTDWVEVSDEDYNLLAKHRNCSDYMLIEHPDDMKTFVGLKTAEYIAKARADEKRQQDALNARTKKQSQRTQATGRTKEEIRK